MGVIGVLTTGLDVLTSKPRLAALADQHSFPFVPHTALDETTLVGTYNVLFRASFLLQR